MSTLPLLKRIAVEYLRPHIPKIIIGLVFMAIAGGMTAAFAQLVQPMLDDVLAKGQQARVVPVALTVLAIFAVRGIATYIHTIIMNDVGQRIIAEIQRRLFNRFMTLDLAFFHENPGGQLMSRIINDVTIMRMAILDAFTGVGKSLFTLLLLAGVMIHQDWKLALATFAILPVTAGFVVWIGRRLRRISRSVQHNMGGLSDRLSQTFSGIRLVKTYGMEAYEITRTEKLIDKVRALNTKTSRVGNMSTPVNELIIGLIIFGILIYGGFQVSNGALTQGQLLSFIAAFSLAYEPMKKLAMLNGKIQTGLGAADRVFEMLDREADITDKKGAVSLKADKATISFVGASFHYNTVDGPALDHVDLELKPDTTTALVGPSGGGKTTIMNLIPRLYDVTDGAVMVNGHDLRDITLASLRRHIAMVSQDITIFNDSVAANIGYGREGASEAEIKDAAKRAAALGFIEQLPEGFETWLGEDGVRLSGGQKQRIAIARAILRDAPILLLDEATSALDTESERAIQDTLNELRKGRTTLIIAHRLSTVKDADKIVVLDQGRIIEQGSHDVLLAARGMYAKLYTELGK